MQQQLGGQTDRGACKPESPVNLKTTNSSNTGSPTIQDVTFRTKLILDELTTNALYLMIDLLKIKIQTCN